MILISFNYIFIYQADDVKGMQTDERDHIDHNIKQLLSSTTNGRGSFMDPMKYRIIVIDGGAKRSISQAYVKYLYNHLISLHCTVIYLEIPLSNFKVTTKDDYDIMGVVFFICSRILIFSREGALEVQQEVCPSFCL